MSKQPELEIPNLVGASGVKNKVGARRLVELAGELEEQYRDRFARLETHVTFIGYPRSGHSLVGSLLDAHPEATIAHELDAFRLIQAGITAEQLWTLILVNSEQFSGRDERTWGPHQYAVPGFGQGSVEQPKVIGDKQGGRTSIRIGKVPGLVRQAMTRIPLKHRFIHCLRNPFDNISTLHQKDISNLLKAAKAYFSMFQVNAAITRKLGPERVFTLYHEDLVDEPQRHLGELCGFLGLDAGEGYLEACAGIIYDSPHKSRHKIEWPDAVRDRITDTLQRLPMLRRYSFDD